MKKLVAVTAGLILGFSLPTFAHSSKDPIKNQVQYRHSTFSLINHHVGKMGSVMKGEADYDKDSILTSAEVVAALAKIAGEGFVLESAVEGSDALPDIWKNKDDFNNELQALIDTSAKLAENAGTESGFKSNFIAVTKTCKSCHNKYKD
ncbi:cytochrome c [Sessilibacter sp. MAH1]